jgi:hypothetical protein
MIDGPLEIICPVRTVDADKREEHLHLDFKTIAEAGLTRRDRRNLAEAISGRRDSAFVVFMSKLTHLSGEAVTPTVDRVRHRQIEIDDNRGFAATLIP